MKARGESCSGGELSWLSGSFSAPVSFFSYFADFFLLWPRKPLTLKVSLGLLVSGFALCAACISTIRHNQDMAAIEAVRFAKIAIIDRNYEQARTRLALRTLNQTSVAKLQNAIENIHKAGVPTSIKAIRYEPLPGQRAMRIYLEGKSANEDFLYLFVMEGDADAGYHVSDVFRLGGTIPPSGLIKPLPVEHTTN